MKTATVVLTMALGVLSTNASAHAPALPKSSHSVSTTTTTLVSPDIFAKWEKVAWCETHGDWAHIGSQYDGGLGIMPWNWIHYGGEEFAKLPHLATPEQQVVIAMRINAGYDIPDQNGDCEPW